MSFFLGKRQYEDDGELEERSRSFKTTKLDMETVYANTLQKLVSGSKAAGNYHCGSQCSSCSRASGTVECSYCMQMTCDTCVRQCAGCQGPFCELCTITNYDLRHDRMFCFHCERENTNTNTNNQVNHHNQFLSVGC
uniref:Apoptosis regulatory protein Siva n=1 Tax=Paramoeba aestuarina TaxID=180227 RepID=A0A7S4KDI2_9EUKA|mmetsp:Transcript_17434/g.27260  ORF Transcript_17434/g.27260 Transcript_17434/m.27260 type:complete len:137 (+) Transcript_17434:56-466(+)